MLARSRSSAQFVESVWALLTGATREETERRMYEAIQMHVEGLIDDKQPVPASTSFAEYVVVST